MKDLTLRIRNDDEITLPASIAGSELTLSEIGAVTILACLDYDQEAVMKRILTSEAQEALALLKEKGVFNIEIEDGVVSFKVNLEAIGL